MFSAWATLALIVFVTLSPIGLRPELTNDPNVERFGAYVVGGMLLALAYPHRIILVAWVIAATAALLEWCQFLTPDRHGQFSDGFVKIAGGILGAGLVALYFRFTRNHRLRDGLQ
jgi:hypothetical protein